MIRRILFATVLGVVALVGAATTASAQGYVVTQRFGYDGTIWRYTSQADALAGVNAVSGSPFLVPNRDLSLYIVDGNANFGIYSNTAEFLSAWSLNGGQTPSNQNFGFIQQYDVDGGSVSSMSTQWNDAAMTSFSFSISGGPGAPGCDTSPVPMVDDCGRLWNAGSGAGSANATAGTFLAYNLSFIATGLAPAVWLPGMGVYESNSNPTGLTGTIWALFENTSTDYPDSRGWYVADLNITLNSLYGTNSDSYFASDVVPEPASMTLLATGLVGLVGAAARRRKRSTKA